MTPTRRATIRTAHDDPEAVAHALAPDNTAEMVTTVEGGEETDSVTDRTESDGAVVTRIDRETTAGLHATVDDYVVNLDVATRVAQHATNPADGEADATDATSTAATETNTDTTHNE
ncbi:KEOPS complex subunit Pcc1 [Halobacteria archaeon AArc-dxtr1]|nr:KEOPS complex subunit Pcc1 [Halobacteria archaeon AArc-dxtr1]